MLAWDGSQVALRAFDVAIDLARRYEGELVAVLVAYSPAHAETHADRQESADAARRYLQQMFLEVKDHEHGFDLIVCGHHRCRRAGRLLLHDVAEALFREARAPVLVVGENSR
ncbi:MAG: universal stress protein [Pseudomonadota bacterium]|nr:universal stress protein [Pseudomonadota bacterium]